MGAEVPIWIEVVVPQYVWVKVYAVTDREAAIAVSEQCEYRLTGECSYKEPHGEKVGLNQIADWKPH